MSTHFIPPETRYHELRAQVLADSTRRYFARGIATVRCQRCQLKQSHCVCSPDTAKASPVEFVLIIHRDELFKPTNTGRLIADCFPQQTHAFCWDRLSPDPALLTLLAEPARQCLIVFPADDTGERPVFTEPPKTEKKLTLLMLDGTWKQGRRMYNLSPWLQHLPALRLHPQARALYATRNAAHENYLSTAESAALALTCAGATGEGQHLMNYFLAFNSNYAATRYHIPKQEIPNS